MRRSALTLALLALLSARAPRGARAEAASPVASATQVVADEASRPAVRARFALRRADGQTEHLELWRSHDRIEHRFVERGYSELWLRDARGQLEHVRSFLRDGKSVHYTNGDLRTIQLSADWQALGSLLEQGELASLLPSGRERSLDARSARVFRGTLRGQPARLAWLEDVALPAQLELGRGKQKVVVTLVNLQLCTAQTCTPEAGPALRSLEFADLGDMEYDTFVRRFLSDSHSHSYSHACSHGFP